MKGFTFLGEQLLPHEVQERSYYDPITHTSIDDVFFNGICLIEGIVNAIFNVKCTDFVNVLEIVYNPSDHDFVVITEDETFVINDFCVVDYEESIDCCDLMIRKFIRDESVVIYSC